MRVAHRILIIEDDAQIAKLVAAELRDADFAVEWAADGEQGLEKLRANPADLVVLDLNLPGIDGLEVCKRIRESSRIIPILMLTARAAKEDVVRGLELGADEYLTKPFSPLELVARIRALFRRMASYREQVERGDAPEPIRRGALLIDPARRETRIGEEPIALTAKEFDLLLLFAKHPGRTFTRAELLNRVWGDGFEGYEHTVNTHINRLRNKVERDSSQPKLIETVWGLGYRLAAQGAE
ncbi:MAG: response regulator transcription factor [Gammaproteobacteria bacterium]